MKWVNRLAFEFGFRYLPPFLLSSVTQRSRAGSETPDRKLLEPSNLRSSDSTTQRDDVYALDYGDVPPSFAQSTRSRFTRGVKSFLQEGHLLCTDFGFRIEDIRDDLPIQLWYGKRDTNVPCEHGEEFAARLGGRAQFRVEDETHSSMVGNCRYEILEELVKCI